MKFLLPLSLLTIAAFAQPPAAAPASNPAPVKAPVPPPALAPNAVVVKVGAKPLTVADMKAILDKLPSDLQEAMLSNPKQSLQSLFLLDYLSNEAARENLASVSPFKEQLEMQRKQLLAQAEVSRRQQEVRVSDDEIERRYTEEKTTYDTAKIRAIFVSFADPKVPAPKPAEGAAPKKTLTEAEAKAKADDLVKKARGGADFAELAKANSEDKRTAANGGVFGEVRRGDQIPEDIKKAIFALKAGGVSDPIKEGPGFYLLKVDEFGTQKLEEVRDQILAKLKQERFQQWIGGLQKQFEVTIENESYFPKPAENQGPALGVSAK